MHMVLIENSDDCIEWMIYPLIGFGVKTQTGILAQLYKLRQLTAFKAKS